MRKQIQKSFCHHHRIGAPGSVLDYHLILPITKRYSVVADFEESSHTTGQEKSVLNFEQHNDMGKAMI